MRIFVDANTIVSGLLFPGNERHLLELARRGMCELVTNEWVRREILSVLARHHGFGPEARQAARRMFSRRIQVLPEPSPEKFHAARDGLSDPDDVPVLVGFEESGADAVVTGDRELLAAAPKSMSTKKALRRILKETRPT